ncbi:MAG: VTT domain-containing protein [bacterium]|nr:VTT domain-containing protein [bacterium]
MISAVLIKYGIWGIMFAGLAEAILLPVPMEVVSIPVYLVRPEKAFGYACVLAICSVIGSMIGYKISNAFGRVLSKKTGEAAVVQKVQGWYQKNVIFTLLTSAVTPIPYELYVVTAGICAVDKKRFIIGSLISRSIRHLPQGLLITYGGNGLVRWCKENLPIVFICIIGIWMIRGFLKRLEK